MSQGAENLQTRATPQQWEQIQDAYIRGEGSLRRLAHRHHLPFSTVEARCRREGWVSLRQKRRDTGLEKVVGTYTGGAVAAPVEDRRWWAERDHEHLQQNLELTRRLRQAVDKKIAEATATELEKLGGALESVVKAERDLLELTPRTAKNKAPSLRPHKPAYGSPEWSNPVPIPLPEPTATDPGHTAS